MKKLTLMTLLALAGIGSNASAYTYTVINKTNQKVTVAITPSAGPTYSWVLAPAGKTIPASQAMPSSLIVPPGIDDVPGTEFGDTHVFKYGALCLNKGSIKVNGQTADFTWPGQGSLAKEIIYDVFSVGSAAVGIYCGDKTISILQNTDGTFVALVPFNN